MKTKVFLYVVLILIFANVQALFAASSASYRIATEILDAGGMKGTSASYKVLGKARASGAGSSSSASFIIGIGFLKSCYFGTVVPPLAPFVTGMTPNSAVNDGPVNITALSGGNFQPGSTVKLSKSGQADIVATGVIIVDSTKITCSFDITGAVSGLWDVTVTNPDGRSGSLPSAFTISYPAPKVNSITPNKGNNNTVVSITDLAGTNFRNGATVKLSKIGESDINASDVLVLSAQKITCSFDLNGKAVSLWDATVTNSDGQSSTLASAFKVESPTLQIIGQVVSIPNPYNPSTGSTTIKYTLSKDANIIIYIYSMRGERVWQSVSPAGSNGGNVGVNEVVWDGITAFRSMASFGVYTVMVTSTDGQAGVLGKTKIAIIK